VGPLGVLPTPRRFPDVEFHPRSTDPHRAGEASLKLQSSSAQSGCDADRLSMTCTSPQKFTGTEYTPRPAPRTGRRNRLRGIQHRFDHGTHLISQRSHEVHAPRSRVHALLTRGPRRRQCFRHESSAVIREPVKRCSHLRTPCDHPSRLYARSADQSSGRPVD
jgi:hypothetical protein